MSELISWLRATIEGDKADALALPHGPWRREGVYPQEISNAEAIVIAATYTDPGWPPDIADHIVRHDPQDTIARCKSELALLALHEDFHECVADTSGLLGMWPACPTVRHLANGYRHRPGFNPEWVAE